MYFNTTATNIENKKGYYPYIDGLRAIAISMVLLYHLDISPLFQGFFLGVDVFFVISGFVITSSILNEIERTGRFSIKRFYRRRIWRLFPALMLMLSIFVLVCIFIYPAFIKEYVVTLSKSAISACLGFSNIFFLIEKSKYFQAGEESRLFIHAWTLSVEEQFYMAVAFLFLSRFIRKRIAVVLSVLMIFSILLNLLSTQQLAKFYLIHYRAYELIIGMLLCLFTRKYKTKIISTKNTEGFILNNFLSVIGLLLIMLSSISVYISQKITPNLIPVAFFTCIGASMIIYSGLFYNKSVINKILSLRPIVFIGKISYSIYLYHLPIIVLTKPTFSHLMQVIFILFCGALSYYLIENPFRERKGFFGKKTTMIVLVSINLVWLISVCFKYDYIASVLSPYEEEIPHHGICFSMVGDKSDPKKFEKCLTSTVKSKKKILLFGDSHAEHYLNIIREYSGKYNIEILSLTGSLCTPIFGLNVDNDYYKKLDREFCPSMRQYIKSNIENGNLSFDGVIISATWRSLDLENFKETLDFFDSHKIPIFVIGKGFHFTVHVLSYLNKNLNGKHIGSNMFVPIRNMSSIDKINHTLEEILSQYPNAMFYTSTRDPKLYDAANKTARIMDAGFPLYRDKSHLTKKGARLNLPLDIIDVFFKISK